MSIGVGVYPEPTRHLYYRLKMRAVERFLDVQPLQKTLDINTASMEQLRAILYKNIRTVHINKSFAEPTMATDLMEFDLVKLDILYQRGLKSFAEREIELKALLIPASKEGNN